MSIPSDLQQRLDQFVEHPTPAVVLHLRRTLFQYREDLYQLTNEELHQLSDTLAHTNNREDEYVRGTVETMLDYLVELAYERDVDPPISRLAQVFSEGGLSAVQARAARDLVVEQINALKTGGARNQTAASIAGAITGLFQDAARRGKTRWADTLLETFTGALNDLQSQSPMAYRAISSALSKRAAAELGVGAELRQLTQPE